MILTAIDCGDLVSPGNGTVVYSGSTFMSIATYICNLGYELRGVNERNCEADGTWRFYSPSCEREFYN